MHTQHCNWGKYYIGIYPPNPFLFTHSAMFSFFADWPVELPLFELIPNTNQVVFQGDRLPFQCKASVIEPDMR